MRNRVTAFRSRVPGQVAAIAVLAGLGAGCTADSFRFKEPMFTGSTANQRSIIGEGQGTAVAQTAPMSASPGAVTSAPLAPPPGAVASSQPGGSWSSSSNSVVTVGPGESLDTLAIKYGVPSAEIARANGISNPSAVTPGKQIVIPRRNAVAYAPSAASPATEAMPMSAPATPAKPVKSAGVIHVVEPGQTLYSIARTQGVRVEDIVALNGLSSASAIRVGQSLKMPSGGAATTQTASLSTGDVPPTRGAPPKVLGTLSADASSPDAMPVPSGSTPPRIISTSKAPEAPPLPSVGASPAPAAPAPAAPVEVASAAGDPPSANGTTFRWPVRGRIVSAYGAKPNGERNDGINLAVPEGTTVKAAEAGVVIYSGNELAGYGNLVLIRHADGWVSAYAHNSQIKVQKGDKVSRGQTIALAGMTGSVTSPQVHFELRKGAKPVNPMDYLASG